MTAPDDLMERFKSIVNEALDNEEKRAKLEEYFKGASSRLEAASQKIENLVTVAEKKDEEIAALAERVANLETSHKEAMDSKDAELASKSEEVKTLEGSVVGLQAEVEKLQTELSEAKASLEEIEKEARTGERMKALEGAGVAFKKEEAAKAQTAKVREMSDEAFEAYMSDLVLAAEQAKETKTVEKQSTEGASVPPPPQVPEGAGVIPASETASVDDSDRVKRLGENLGKLYNTVVRNGSAD